MADLLGAQARTGNFGPPAAGNLVALRAWVLATGGPAANDLISIHAWIMGYNGGPPPPDTGG